MLWLSPPADREMRRELQHWNSVLCQRLSRHSASNASGGCRVSGYRRLGSVGLLELHDLALEVADVLEALVDRGEAQVRDRVEGAQALEHGQPENSLRDLGALARARSSTRRRRAPRPPSGATAPPRDRVLDAGLRASPGRTAPISPERFTTMSGSSSTPLVGGEPPRRTRGTPAGAGPRRPRRPGASRRPCRRSTSQYGQRTRPR